MKLFAITGLLIGAVCLTGFSAFTVFATEPAAVPPVVVVNQSFTAPNAVLAYLDTHRQALRPADYDRLILQLLDLQAKLQPQYEAELFSDAVNPKINQYPPQVVLENQNIKEANIRELVQKICQDGFKLSWAEGMIYIESDYPLLNTRYGKLVSKRLAGYLQIMADETTRHFAADASLTIPVNTVSDRIVRIETFLNANPDFAKNPQLRQLMKNYLSAYLLGLNNSPAFDYQTLRLNDSFRSSYQRTIKQYPRTKLGTLVGDYLKLLEQNNYRRTQAILDYVTKNTQ